MNIDKAIEILSESAYRGVTTFSQDFKDAQILGIAALIFYRKLKSLNTGEIQGNFLGETEE